MKISRSYRDEFVLRILCFCEIKTQEANENGLSSLKIFNDKIMIPFMGTNGKTMP